MQGIFSLYDYRIEMKP